MIEQFGDLYRQRLSKFRVGSAVVDLARIRPQPRVWSALEYTVHFCDVVAFYSDRIDRIVTKDRPRLAAVDFAMKAETDGYQNRDLDATMASLAETTDSAATRLRGLVEGDWKRKGIGSGGDDRSVLDLARRLAHDGHHHLIDLDRVLIALSI